MVDLLLFPNFDSAPQLCTFQVILALLSNFSSIGPSMTLGFSAVAIPTLKTTLSQDQITWFGEYQKSYATSPIPILFYSHLVRFFTASLASLAAPVGCFFSGPISDRFGRRSAIFCINVTCFVGWLVVYTAHSSKNHQYLLLLLGRLLTGLSLGLSSAPATVYMAEVSSLKYRGVFTMWASIFFSLGISLVYILGLFLKVSLSCKKIATTFNRIGVLFFQESWGSIALITCFFPCIGMLFVVFFVPESPSWLVGKNRLEEAKKNMCRIFGTKDYHPQVQSEIERLIKAKGVKEYINRKSVLEQMLRKVKYLLKPHCLRPFCLVFTYFIFQQFSGTFVLVFYAIDIVKKAGVTLDPYLTIVMIGSVRFLTAIMVGFISRSFGRKSLSIVSGLGMTLCMFTLACYNLLVDQGKISEGARANLTLLPLMALLFYFFTSTLGFLPVPFALAAELFPTKIRGTASGLLTGFNYTFNFIAVKIYPSMIDSMGSTGVFFFYGATALIGTVFSICLLPETKGKSLEEILEHFGGKKIEARAEEAEYLKSKKQNEIEEKECLKT